MAEYRRLTYEERCRIEAQLSIHRPIREISQKLGFHQSSIYREIKRNSLKRYEAKLANKRAEIRKQSCRRKTVLTKPIERVLKKKLIQGWSPEQITGRWEREGYASISYQTIYRYTKNNNLYRGYLRTRRKRGAGRYLQRRRQKPRWMRFISQRPLVVKNRRRLGDWERDTMFVKDRRQVLVIAERKSRLTKIAKLRVNTQKQMAIKTKELLRGKKVHTITNDNDRLNWDGNYHDYLIYFCKPFKPQQRGTVENTIGLVRHYLGRKTDLKYVSDKKIAAIEMALNNRPRKCLDYRTPNEVFYKKKFALAM